jgi:hypothetical protein
MPEWAQNQTTNKMSWNVSLLGTPENIIKALDAELEKQGGQSKVEMESALPHLKGLVGQVTGTNSKMAYCLNASGHGFIDINNPDNNYNHCQCDFRQIGRLC